MVVPRSTGAVTDRPWGITLGGLGIHRFTGRLTVTADGKEYSISFDLGRIVGATSPLASDAAVRMALTNHLVSSSQATELNRRVLAAHDRDEIEVLAEIAELKPEHVAKLRHRVVLQRAARTFSLERGTYFTEEKITMPPGADLDVREVIYLGARMNLSEQRLAEALRAFGSVFTIKPDALPSLEHFGFTAEERPVIEGLLGGASLPQLEAAHRDVDPRMVQAIAYSLMACGVCDAERGGTAVAYTDGPEATPRTHVQTEGATYFVSRTATNPAVSRTQTSDPPTSRNPPGLPPTSRTQTSDLATSRTQTTNPATSRTETGEPITSRPPTSDPTGFRGEPAVPRTATPRPNASTSGVRAPGQPTIPRVPRTASRPEVASPRTRTSDPTPGQPAPTGPIPAVARTATGPVSSRTQTSDPAVSRTASGRPLVARTSTARRTQALIAARMHLLDQASDYFTLLGVPFDAPIDVIQTAYLNLVRQLHPTKLEELGILDASGNAQRLFQQIGIAFTVLTDPTRRAAHLEKIAHPPAAVEMTSRTRTADDIPATPAGDAFRRGESALRRDEPSDAVVELGRACALEPNNVDFHAMLGWAQFCAARDKVTIAPETRKALERAVQRSAKPTQARFLLGRVERMLGRDREALRHFQEVVDARPSHAEAAAEIRAIEARLAKASKH